jgi:hypothetical protein
VSVVGERKPRRVRVELGQCDVLCVALGLPLPGAVVTWFVTGFRTVSPRLAATLQAAIDLADQELMLDVLDTIF